MPLDPPLGPFLELIAAQPHLADGTPDEAREAFRGLARLRDPATVAEVAGSEDLVLPGPAGEIPARLYRPETGAALPTVVFLHGGGWTVGDLDVYDACCRRLATESRAAVLSVDYRLAPEHPFPAAVEDTLAAVRWADEHRAELGGGEGLAVAGDSAGGNLSAVAAQVCRDEDRPLAGQLLIYPATDLAGDYPSRAENGEGYFLDLRTMTWFTRNYAPRGTDVTDPRLSPRHGDLAGLAPAIVLVAEFDPLRDEGAAYADALEEAGVPTTLRRYDGLIHGFFDMDAFSPAAEKAVLDACGLLRDLLHR